MGTGQRRAAPLLALLALVVACGPSSEVSWRDVDLTLPQGWTVFERSERNLSLADGPLGTPGDPGERGAAAYLTYEPRTLPDDWRRFVDEQPGGELEEDDALTLDGIPATRLVFVHASNGVPIREMVVVVPARGIVMLFQPVVTVDATDGPERFRVHRAEFERILASIEFGAPVEGLGRR